MRFRAVRVCVTHMCVACAQVWAGTPGGIITTLKSDYAELFKGVRWPSTQSVINHVTHKNSGLLAKHKHLYTSGLEQQEPAQGGTEGTKDERPLGELEQLIIEVAELYNEAKMAKEEAAAEKKGEAKKADSRGKDMQNEAVKGHFDDMSPGERAGSREARKQARAKRGGGGDDDDFDSDDDARSVRSSRSTGSGKHPQKRRRRRFISVRDYMAEQYLPESDFEKIQNGEKSTPHYKLLTASESEELGYDEAMLEKIQTSGLMDSAGSLRSTVSASLKDFSEAAKEKAKIAQQAEANRAAERKRELDLQEREMKLREEKAEAEKEEKKMMMSLLQKMADKV